MFLHWVLYLVLAILLIAGLYINLLGAPGLWVMVVSTIIYAIFTGGAYAAMKTIIAIIAIAGLAELLEFVFTGSSAKRAGASRRGLWGAIIGSIVGGLFFTAILPVPILGTIFGVCLGTFVGAMVGELWGGTEVGVSLRVGYGAAKGRLAGIIMKLFLGIAIIATVMIAAMPPFHPFYLFHHRGVTPATMPGATPTIKSVSTTQPLARS